MRGLLSINGFQKQNGTKLNTFNVKLMTPNNKDLTTRSEPIPQAPTAGFQTLWVQRQLKKLRERTEALKAQYIKPDDII